MRREHNGYFNSGGDYIMAAALIQFYLKTLKMFLFFFYSLMISHCSYTGSMSFQGDMLPWLGIIVLE